MSITLIKGLDVNPGDRVYSSDSGYKVKVRVTQVDTGSPDRLSFRITGSLTNDEGRSEVFGDGHFIVQPHELTVHSDTTADLATLIENERLAMVVRVERVVINQAQLDALTLA